MLSGANLHSTAQHSTAQRSTEEAGTTQKHVTSQNLRYEAEGTVWSTNHTIYLAARPAQAEGCASNPAAVKLKSMQPPAAS